jgi:hypothetical protein
MRLTLPVDLPSKTMSEVATIEYTRYYTHPAQQVFCHQAVSANELELEWILIDYVPSRRLHREWKGMSYEKNVELVRKMVPYHAQHFQKRFNRLHNLYPADELL